MSRNTPSAPCDLPDDPEDNRYQQGTDPAAVVLAIVFPFVFDLPLNVRTEYFWATPAILLGVCLSPLVAFRSVVQARQQNYVFQFALIAQAVVTTVLAVGCAWVGFGLAG